VKDKHRFRELHRVNGAIGTAYIVLDDLKDTGTAEALERLCRVMLIPSLSEIQGMTEELPHIERKRHEVALAPANPDQQLLYFSHFASLYHFRYELNPELLPRSQRRLSMEMLSAKVGPELPIRPQHLSVIESGKLDPRLSSIERMAEA
jgi:hypothetical protein